MYGDNTSQQIILDISMETIQNFLFGRKLNSWHEPLKSKLPYSILFVHKFKYSQNHMRKKGLRA